MNMQTVAEVAKSAPPVTVGVFTLWGLELNQWAQVLAIVWTLFLIIEKAPVIWTRLCSLASLIKKGYQNVISH